MANGWTPDGAVQVQIDGTVKDAVLRARVMMPAGEGSDECDDCGEDIPAARRAALPGPGPALPVSRSATQAPVAWGSTGAAARIANALTRRRVVSPTDGACRVVRPILLGVRDVGVFVRSRD
jgi:hypothetical protein